MKDINYNKFGARFKLIYAIVQICIFYILISVFPNYELLCILGIVISYLVPFYFDSYMIKFQKKSQKLSKYYFEDIIFYYLPSIGGSLILEIILYFIGINKDIIGFFTVVFFIVFSLLTAFQMFRQFLQYKITKRMDLIKERTLKSEEDSD